MDPVIPFGADLSRFYKQKTISDFDQRLCFILKYPDKIHHDDKINNAISNTYCVLNLVRNYRLLIIPFV